MDNEKIDEIGEKLNVNSLEIKKKPLKRFNKFSFWIIHSTNFFLSILVGVTFGIIGKSNYPYQSTNKISAYSLIGVSSINIANGVYTIPKRKYFKLNQFMRIGIYIINLIISFAVSMFLFQSLGSYGAAVRYGVYKSPTKSNIH